MTDRRLAVLAPPLRVPAMVAVTIAAVVLAVLTARYAGTSVGGELDVQTESFLTALAAGHIRPAEFAIQFGDPGTVTVIAALLAGACLWMRRVPLAVVAFVGPGLTGLATTMLKPLIGRTIDGSLAFPSGHTGGATSLAIAFALVALSRWRPPALQAGAVLFGVPLLVGAGMATALVLVDAHYATDTVGGFCTAVIGVLGVALLVDAVTARRSPRPG